MRLIFRIPWKESYFFMFISLFRYQNVDHYYHYMMILKTNKILYWRIWMLYNWRLQHFQDWCCYGFKFAYSEAPVGWLGGQRRLERQKGLLVLENRWKDFQIAECLKHLGILFFKRRKVWIVILFCCCMIGWLSDI